MLGHCNLLVQRLTGLTSYYYSDSTINLPSNKVIIGEIQGFSTGSTKKLPRDLKGDFIELS